MAYFVSTPADNVRIEETLTYLDPGSQEPLTDLRERMSAADWEFVITYIRRRIRSALEIELMARSLAETALRHGLADEKGSEHFLRSKSWLHNFGVTQTTDEYFTALSLAHENKLHQALDALIMIAQDRLFDRLDEEYERLLRPSP